MFNVLWKITKSIPIFKKIVVYIYNFIHGNRKQISGKNNLFILDLANHFPFLKQNTILIKGDHNKIMINSGAKISNTQFKINGNYNEIVIQDNCFISGGCIWIESDRSKIIIGKNTTIVKANIGIAESDLSIVIGKNCMFAHDIDIRCGDSHSIIDLKSHERINYAQNISIGDSVWLATGVKIFKSLTIGKGAIIGAGSIVTKDIPENSLAVGIPAQVKKTDVTWLKEKLPPENGEVNLVTKILAHQP
jgi:acetyltransferase-like isoleucine patch superfamily enzyme